MCSIASTTKRAKLRDMAGPWMARCTAGRGSARDDEEAMAEELIVEEAKPG